MTLTPDIAVSSSEEADRNLALLAYALLFFAIFFAGAPALAGVAIAYSRKGRVGRLVRGHHRFQIFIFWGGLALTLLAALSGLAAALGLLLEIVSSAAGRAPASPGAFSMTVPYLGPAVSVFAIAAVCLGVVSGLWLMITAGYGFARLAGHRTIRRTANGRQHQET